MQMSPNKPVSRKKFDQIEAPPGVIEAVELYEAVIPHYVAAAARLDPISRISSTSAALAASFPTRTL